MKRYYSLSVKLIALIFCLATGLDSYSQSCKVTCTPSSLSFGASGGYIDVTFSTTCTFTTSCTSSFYSVTQVNSNVLRVTCEANTQSAGRGGAILLNSGSAGYITVSQQAAELKLSAPAYISGPTSVCMGTATGYNCADVSGAGSYKWTVSGPGSILSGNGTSSIVAQPLSAGNSFQLCVVASYGSVNSPSVCTTISSPVVSTTPSSISFPSSGGTQDFTIQGSCLPSVTSTSSFFSASYINANTVRVICQANSATTPRGGAVLFAGGSGGCVTVSQAPFVAAPASIAGPSSFCVSGSASYTAAAVPEATSYVWTATGCTIISGQNSATVTIIGTTAGTAQLSVVAMNGSFPSASTSNSITINKATLGSTALAFNDVGTSQDVAISGPCSPVLSTSSSFIHASYINSSIRVYCDPNTTLQERGGAVLLDNGPGGVISIRQAPTLPAPTSISGATTLSVGIPSNYTVSTVSGATSYRWAVTGNGCSINSGQGTNSVAVTCLAVGAAQLAVVAQNSTSTSPSISMGLNVPFITTSVSSLSFPSAGSYQDITISGPYFPSFSCNSSFFSASYISSNVVRVTCQTNAGLVPREGAVVFAGGSGTVFIKQAASLPTPSISGSTAICVGNQGSYTATGATGATTYQWTAANCTILSGSTTATVSVQFNTVGTAKLSCMASNGASSSANGSATITVNKAILSSTSLSFTDAGTSQDVSFSGTCTPSLTTSASFIHASYVTNSNSIRIYCDPNTTLSGKSGAVLLNGGLGGTISISQSPTLPVPSVLSVPSTVCYPSSATVSISAVANASSYAWTATGCSIVSGQGTASIVVSPTAAGTARLSVVAKNSNATSLARTIDVFFFVVPTSDYPVVATQSCFGTGTVSFSITKPVSAYTYAWYDANMNLLAARNSYSASLSEGKSLGINLMAIHANGCSSLIKDILSASAFFLPKIISSSEAIPTGGQVSLSVDHIYDQYQWALNGENLNGATASTLQATKTGSYTVQVGMATAGSAKASSGSKVLKGAMASQNLNYISTQVVLVEGVKTVEDLNGLPIGSVLESTTYLDGLGRDIQIVNTKASPSKKDLVLNKEYDQMGREAKKYLPYTSGTDGLYKKDGASLQQNFYEKSDGISIPQDKCPYALTLFDGSPLNRVVKQGAAGTVWQPVDGSTSDHVVRMDYLTNGTEVDQFVMDGDACKKKGSYAAGQLFVNQVTDENGHTAKEYKDGRGLVIMKLLNDAKTYYVYDDLGHQRYILPPMAVQYIASKSLTSFTASDATIKNLVYYYRYDTRGRLIEKRLPAVAPIYMVYDQRDRLILSQDGNGRKKSEWIFTKYDNQDRAVLTGKCSFSQSTQDDMQLYYDNNNVSAKNESLTDGNEIGYTNNAFPTAVTTYLTATYYDHYRFKGAIGFDASSVISGSPTQNNPYVKGLVTGSRVLIMDGNGKYTLTTTYYDDHYRPIQVSRANILPSTVSSEIIDSQYDFAGRILKTKQLQTVNGKATTILKKMAYDHAGRLLTTDMAVTNATVKTPVYKNLSTLTYNEVGQLMNKKMGGIDETNYLYSIRGWLKKMNSLVPTGLQHFGMELFYNDVLTELPNAPQWNGNISGMKWTSASPKETFAYVFGYDAFNRLTSADFGRSSLAAWKTAAFSESNITYDLNGNIQTYKRNDKDGAALDDLKYTYDPNSSNQLIGIANGGNSSLKTYKTAYTYDVNGNLTANDSKGIQAISYNYLNLAEDIELNQLAAHQKIIHYVYDAEGTRLFKEVSTDGLTSDHSQYYAGNIIYDKDKNLRFILTEEGRVLWANNAFSYEFYVKDHLGNIRMVLSETGTVKQETHYYPFGLAMKGLGSDASSPANDYLYNGNELQTDFDLNWTDYGARMYDAEIGRWWSVDPKAEKYYGISPYVYCSSNSVNAFDYGGAEIIFVNGYYNAYMPGFVGDVGGKPYWSIEFVNAAKIFFGDGASPLFIDGRGGMFSSGSDRFEAGYKFAMDHYDDITKNIFDANGIQTDPVNFVTHSMGAAYSEGMIKYLEENNVKVDVVVHLSPADPSEFLASSNPVTLQLTLNGDFVLGYKNYGEAEIIKGVDRYGLVKTFRGVGNDVLNSHFDTKWRASTFGKVSDLLNVNMNNYGDINPLPNIGATFYSSGTNFNTSFQYLDINGSLYSNIYDNIFKTVSFP